MFKEWFWSSLTQLEKTALLQRPFEEHSHELTQKVREIINRVKQEKDQALLAYTKEFDAVDLNSLRVEAEEVDAAMNAVDPKVILAFEHVMKQLRCFHKNQSLRNYAVETSLGLVCERVVVPIQRVGLYVPAGTAPLVSTVLMLGLPSQMAECPLRVLCVPPNKEGKIDPQILVAARCCGIEEIFKVGGAQAIAAMAYGTESIPKVDKIFGPGNAWVTRAKMLVSLDPKGAQQDLPAGPSEVLVLADDKANPAFVAADLLSQAEHGMDSQVVLVCRSQSFAQAVSREIERQLQTLSRAPIAKEALKNSLCCIVDTSLDAIDIVNEYAPEHLIIQTQNPRLYLKDIYNAGSIFLGPWSAESIGDYVSGTNHILPTAGFAKSCSGLSLSDFTRTMSVQEISQEGLACLKETVGLLTAIEGLDAHFQAINIRLQGAQTCDQ